MGSMTTTTTRSFTVRAIDAAVVAELLDVDDAGHGPRIMVDEDGGSPLRCCLRLSQPGERVALVSYAPLRRWANAHHVDAGPYDEVGPIFVHPAPCDGTDDDGYPSELVGSSRMLRAYSAGGGILRGILVEPDGAFDTALEELLSDPKVAVVHGRALEFGCFTFEVRRKD